MKKFSLVSAFLGLVCILNQAGNSAYLLDYEDNNHRYIHISYPVANNHLPPIQNQQPEHFDLFDALHRAFNKKENHVNNNVDIPLTFHFWKTEDSHIHNLATQLFILKAKQQNPQNAQLNFIEHDI